MVNSHRRNVLAGLAFGAGGLVATKALAGDITPSRVAGIGGNNIGPQDAIRSAENPDMINPPSTDHGNVPNLRFSFADAHVRQSSGGWTRQVTMRELAASHDIAGVEMRLNPGGIRELHWHKEAEWAFMVAGNARITAIDANGHNFVDDVGVGDLWYFPPGMPHSIQGLDPDGTQFLLVFDDGSFDEDSTFLLSDWFKHVPNEVLAKNFNLPASMFGHTPDPSKLYMFAAAVPGPLGPNKLQGVQPLPHSFKHRLMAQTPIQAKGGTVRIADSSNFPPSKTIAAALVDVEPGAMRELHWHPNTNEWQYYLEGTGRMGVFASNGQARTFDFRAGDVGYVPFAMGHYIENTGSTPLRFLEIFKSDHYVDISLDQWLAFTPPPLVEAHLHLGDKFANALNKTKDPVVA